MANIIKCGTFNHAHDFSKLRQKKEFMARTHKFSITTFFSFINLGRNMKEPHQ